MDMETTHSASSMSKEEAGYQRWLGKVVLVAFLLAYALMLSLLARRAWEGSAEAYAYIGTVVGWAWATLAKRMR